MINRTPVRDRPGALGWRRGSQYRGSRVTPGEGRDLSFAPCVLSRKGGDLTGYVTNPLVEPAPVLGQTLDAEVD